MALNDDDRVGIIRPADLKGKHSRTVLYAALDALDDHITGPAARTATKAAMDAAAIAAGGVAFTNPEARRLFKWYLRRRFDLE